MRMRVMVGLVIAVVATVLSATAAPKAWPKFEGTWFGISYPPGWSVRGSRKSLTARKGYDSAFFTSKDKNVEFYVFSPQGSYKAFDIVINDRREKYLSRKVQVRATKTTTSVTLRALDKSYTRSYVDTRDSATGFRVVFGIKYRNEATYKKHKAEFLKFKGSLVRYAD